MSFLRPWMKKLFIALVFLVFLPGLLLGSGYYYLAVYTGAPLALLDSNGKPLDLEKPSHEKLKRASYIRDNKGQIIGRFFEEVRNPVRLGEIPLILRQGLVAAEDKKYYKGIMWGMFSHPGIDPAAIFRAFVGNMAPSWLAKYLNYSKLSGASGISQQYSTLLYTEELPEFRTRAKNYGRKIKQARIAIQLDQKYSKDKILEDFFNLIYFGHGVNGIAEALKRYFNKDILSNLITLREVSILVSLNKSPYLFCPIFHRPDESKMEKSEYDRELAKEILRVTKARDRYNWVMKRMLEDGYITQKEYDDAFFKKDEPFELESLKIEPLNNPQFSYGNRLVKEFMLGQGFNDSEISYYGGFQIYTTFDQKIQKIASEEFEKHLQLVNEGKSSEDRINGAFIIIENATGDIKAMSGGYDFNESQYNRVIASRSPGSGIKPLVIASIMENYDLGLFDKVCNCPFSMRGSSASKRWSPKNFEERNPVPTGYVDISKILYRSVNLGTLNAVMSHGGIKLVISTMNDMGVWGNPGIVRDSHGDIWFRRPGFEVRGGLVPLLPTAIGASDVNLLELANAYSVFFRDGIYMKPRLIRELRDAEGKPIVKFEPSYQERVLSEETVNKMLAMMRAVAKIGTAQVSMRGIEQPVACKTGTSDGPRDVSIWCGTPEYFIGIRFGLDDYGVIELQDYMKKMSGDGHLQVTGGWVAGPLMRRIIDRIYADRVKSEFSYEVEDMLEEIISHN